MHTQVIDICGTNGKLVDDKGARITTCSDDGSSYLYKAIKARMLPVLDR